MSITLDRATPDSVDDVVEAVASWQQEGGAVQLHPGDLGWARRFGAPALAGELRVWRRDGRIVAAGAVDADDALIRMAISPEIDDDTDVAARLLADLTDPEAGVLPAGRGFVESRAGAAFRELLTASGWTAGESWTPLRLDLSSPVPDPGRRIELLDADHVDERVLEDRVTVGRASFPNSTFSRERWREMAAGAAYRRARCLVAYDDDGAAVAATTVWSAGEGRPGLIEPLGTHHDHRGRGHGRAITLAAAAALRELGSSSVTVCTPTSNVGGVAAYVAAGLEELPAVTDFRRPG